MTPTASPRIAPRTIELDIATTIIGDAQRNNKFRRRRGSARATAPPTSNANITYSPNGNGRLNVLNVRSSPPDVRTCVPYS